MGPVSFETIARKLSNEQALELAKTLRKSGIQAQLAENNSCLVVRSNDVQAAKRVLDSLQTERTDT